MKEKTIEDKKITVTSHGLSPTTRRSQPCHKKRKVKKKKRRPPQTESESEEENKLCRKYRNHRRPPVKDSRPARIGQQPASSLQSISNTGMSKDWKCKKTYTIRKDAAVNSAEKKWEPPSPGKAGYTKDDTQCPYHTTRLKDPNSARSDHCNGERIQTYNDSIKAIHHQLTRALSKRICYSEVELSDSSDSTDINSIAEEKWTYKMISNKEITQEELNQKVGKERREENGEGEDARSRPVMSSQEESKLQQIDQHVAEERIVAEGSNEGAKFGPVRSSNQESTIQELDQEVAKEKNVEWGKGASSITSLSINEESTPPTAALRQEDKLDNGETHERLEITHEEGLLSQITDLIAVLQECDEVDQLVLRNTGMTDSLLQHLVPAIIVSKSEVQSINLNLNEISPGGAESLIQLLRKKPCVQSLLLYGNQLGDKGIKTLVCGLSEILVTQRKMETPLSYIMLTDQLSELDIGGNQMSSEALKSIADYLRLNPFLKHLGLAQISVQAAAAWQELFDALKINTNLTHLLLDDNGLSNTGARLVAEVIQVNRSLVTIDLDGNGIGEEGGGTIAESLASTTDMALTTISLDNNQISKGTMAAIQTLLRRK